MKALVSKKKEPSKTKEFFLTAIAYALFESGMSQDDVVTILLKIEKTAEMMVEDYIEFCDIRKVLKDEYDFVFKFR